MAMPEAKVVVLFPDGAWEPTEVPAAYHGNSYHLTFSGGAGVNFTFTGEHRVVDRGVVDTGG